MEAEFHSMSALFQQLGLPATPSDIETFIGRHRPLPKDLALHQAHFWSPSQAAFLKQDLDDDAEWAELVDELDAQLRH